MNKYVNHKFDLFPYMGIWMVEVIIPTILVFLMITALCFVF